jgi:hypothetical protein
MKNTIRTINSEKLNLATVEGFAKGLEFAVASYKDASNAFSKLAPFALVFSTVDKDSNLDPINKLYVAMSAKTADQTVLQKKLVTFVSMYAGFLAFDKDAKSKPFAYKTTKGAKGIKKNIDPSKRVLGPDFALSLDFRICEKAKDESEKKKPLVTEKTVKSFSEKLASTFNTLEFEAHDMQNPVTAEKAISDKRTLESALIELALSFCDREILLARLAPNAGDSRDEAETELTREEQKAAVLRGDADSKQA